MKKAIIVLSISVILLAHGLIASSFSAMPKNSEREYVIRIPERLIDAYWLVIHDQTAQLSVGQFRELVPLMERQIRDQASVYQKIDSAAAAKARIDTTKPKQ